jgi:TfoX/Sxy family transcriptional regulator of competence genes
MAYNQQVAERVREYLATMPDLQVEEKKMFGGLAFLVGGKMCVNVSGDHLMCRFNPRLTEEIVSKKGYQPLTMKGKQYQGYCYVDPTGFQSKTDFEYWMTRCLEFNQAAKATTGKRRIGN